jgi:hypothetical protein
VIGKAEWTRGEANPRFVVTSLARGEIDGRVLYERVYCARGDMEKRVKECQLDLFAGRASAATMRANQLRLWFASMAYVLLCALRRIGFAHAQFADATCGTLRLALLRIGAQVRRSVRRISVAMASAHPGCLPCRCLAWHHSPPGMNSKSSVAASQGLPIARCSARMKAATGSGETGSEGSIPAARCP